MAAEDLTSLASVREAADSVTGETDDDALIGSYITRASVAIMRYAKREFAPTTDAAERRFKVRGRTIDLAPYDLRSVDSVELHPLDASPTTLTSAQYLLEPVSAPDGVYNRLTLASDVSLDADSVSDFGVVLVDVTGDWGFTAVPADVEHACISTVLSWLRRDVSQFEIDYTSDAVPNDPRPSGTFGLPRAVRATLDRYRRIVVA